MSTDPTACPLLAALVADHAAHRPQREEGRRMAEETRQAFEQRIQRVCATSRAIAKARVLIGLAPFDVLTPRMIRDRLFEPRPVAQIGPRIGLAPGLAEALQPKKPDA